MTSRYQLLVFDWDGTLMDSAGELVSTLQQAIQGIGLPERDPREMRQLIGLGLNEVLARLFPEFDTDRLRRRLERYRARYGGNIGRSMLFPSVVATLDRLREEGYEMAVATGKSRRGLDAALARTDTARLFDITRCADETRSKPSPLMLEQILLCRAVPADHSLMIGDTEYDVAMARAAGVDALGVAWGVHDAERLRLAGAIDVIDAIERLPEWLVQAHLQPAVDSR